MKGKITMNDDGSFRDEIEGIEYLDIPAFIRKDGKIGRVDFEDMKFKSIMPKHTMAMVVHNFVRNAGREMLDIMDKKYIDLEYDLREKLMEVVH